MERNGNRLTIQYQVGKLYKNMKINVHVNTHNMNIRINR